MYMDNNVGETPAADQPEPWPSLPLQEWKDAYATLHMWTQIVGKIRMVLSPPINHWWHVPLYVTSRGLTTSRIPYGSRSFEMEFDFIEHLLEIRTSDMPVRTLALAPRSVADFYEELMATLLELGILVKIWTMPVEVPNPIPFDQDELHASYDPDYANRFWRILLQTDRVIHDFRSTFIGKCSPVHFFWGSFDLTQTRFSGRLAPEHPGSPNVGRQVMVEAYSHEVSSCGFWPGEGALQAPAFYAYAYPEPPGYSTAPISPEEAVYHPEMGEYVLLYEDVRTARNPDATLMAFLQSTYQAAADLGHWDRQALER